MLKDGAAYSQSGPQVAVRLSAVRGAPATRAEIAFASTYGFGDQREIELLNVEIVFKDGIGYDSGKLIESVRGQVGIR
jgi:hypothetical protein